MAYFYSSFHRILTYLRDEAEQDAEKEKIFKKGSLHGYHRENLNNI